MPSKFGHERLNRQEKAWKEPGGCVGGKESPRLWEPVFSEDYQDCYMRLNPTVDRLLRRTELMKAFDAGVRRQRFIVSNFKFVFSWTPKEFAVANGLSLQSAEHVFDEVSAEAEEKLRVVKQRIRRSGFSTYFYRDAAGYRVEGLSLNYRELWNFFQKDDGI